VAPVLLFLQLEELSLSSNNFSCGLNPALGRLRLLKKLDLELCELTTLPECLGDLEQVSAFKAALFCSFQLVCYESFFAALEHSILIFLRGTRVRKC